jgi:hypothetical protein
MQAPQQQPGFAPQQQQGFAPQQQQGFGGGIQIPTLTIPQFNYQPPAMNFQQPPPAQQRTMPSMSMPSLGGYSPGAQAGGAGNWQSALAPLLAALLSNYYQSSAGLQQQGQQAQADSGLNWAGIGQDVNNTTQRYRDQGQGNILSFLGGLPWF